MERWLPWCRFGCPSQTADSSLDVLLLPPLRGDHPSLPATATSSKPGGIGPRTKTFSAFDLPAPVIPRVAGCSARDLAR